MESENNKIQSNETSGKNGNAISPKYINIIYEFCLARQKHGVWIAAVPEPCSTAALVELNCLPSLIQKFDSDAVLLPCFCRTSFLNLVRHGRSTTSELGLITLKEKECSVTIFQRNTHIWNTSSKGYNPVLCGTVHRSKFPRRKAYQSNKVMN